MDWPNKPCMDGIHPKLCNINLHNVTHSMISQNPTEWLFLVEIPFLIDMFLSLISWVLPLMQTIKEVNPHPRIAPHVYMWDAFFLFLFFLCFLCHLLNHWCMEMSHCPRSPSGRLTCEDDFMCYDIVDFPCDHDFF